MKANTQQQPVRIKNKRAYFDYEILEKFVCGMQLFGTEVKSIRRSKASINESFCSFTGHELFVINMHIADYDFGNINNHENRRDRKLLLKKKELHRIQKKVKESGLTVIPLTMFMNGKGLVKLEIGIARGKKTYDKRETLKKDDARREMDRVMKQ